VTNLILSTVICTFEKLAIFFSLASLSSGTTTLSITTKSILTLSIKGLFVTLGIMTLSIKGLFATLSRYDNQNKRLSA